MITRRWLIKLLAALPFSKTVAPLPVCAREETLSTDPTRRLWQLRHRFEALAPHKWKIDGPSDWAYWGDGWTQARPPMQEIYHHHLVVGEGTSAIEAIDDWYSKLPTSKCDAIMWRLKPDLERDLDFDSKRERWSVYSSFAIRPLDDARSTPAGQA